MISILFFIVFLLITSFFGFVVARFFIEEKKIFALIPLSIIIGLAAYNFLVNIVGHFVPIQTTVWLVLTIFAITSVLVIYVKKAELKTPLDWVFSKKKNSALLGIALIISILSGITAIKSLALDDMFVGHIPLAVTITQGNFPVMDPMNPDRILSYHYGSDLLSAVINLISGIPVWLGYDIQIFIFSGTFFLLLFVLLYDITGKYGGSVVGASLFLYGTGLQWIYFFTKGIPAFWHRFILHEEVPAFWKFLTDVAYPKLNTSFIHTMHNHSTSIGMPILILVLIIYFRALLIESKKKAGLLAGLAGIMFGYLALNLETYYVIELLAFLTLFIIFILDKKWKWFGNTFTTVRARNFVLSTCTVVIVGVAVAFLQGGVLTSVAGDVDREELTLVQSFDDFMTMNFAPNPSRVDNSETYIRIFSPDFFIQFGIPILAIIPALIYFFRKKNGLILHLVIIALGAFTVPFIFRLPTRVWEVSRFFVLAIPLFSLLIGLYFSELYGKYHGFRKKRLAIATLTMLVGLTGVISQLIFNISSIDTFGKIGPLVKRPPGPVGLDIPAYEWIKETTTLEDRFFPYDSEFTRMTGRFTPGYFPYFTFNLRIAERDAYASIIEECSIEGFRFFGIDYIYVSPQFPIKDLERCLKKIDAIPLYATAPNKDFRAIYKIDL